MIQHIHKGSRLWRTFLLTIAFILTLQCKVFALAPGPAAESDNEPVETVTIDSVEYTVPPPWAGNKLQPPSFSGSTFLQIPLKYSENESQIYILDKTLEPLLEMLETADNQGVLIQVASAYRSPAYQSKIFTRLFAEGRTFDDIIRYVAPPGYSQHMLGIAVDFSPSNWRFASTRQYAWLSEHAEEYGFTETYSKYNSMNMPWEAWHWSLVQEE